MREDDLPQHVGELIRHGRIASVNLAAGTMTVALGEFVTQPIRWFTASGGTRVWLRPKIGEQVTLICPDGDLAGAIGFRGFPSAAFPTLNDPARELIRFEDGAIVAYNPASHLLEAVLPAGGKVDVVAPGGVTIHADVRITGDLVVDGKADVTGDVDGEGVSLAHHRHGGVKSGGDQTGQPS